jgi:hypothetical protein
MTNIIIGCFIGSALTYPVLMLLKYIMQKRGIRYSEYKKLPLLVRLNDTLRHIIYDYGIKKRNHDFSLNVLERKVVIMQVLHRAHFPYLTPKNENPNFGMALYIPISKLTETQKKRLEEIIVEEPLDGIHETEPFDFHVVDLGQGLRQGGYLIARILKEIFDFDSHSSDFDFKLFNEGELPYFAKKFTMKVSSN